MLIYNYKMAVRTATRARTRFAALVRSRGVQFSRRKKQFRDAANRQAYSGVHRFINKVFWNKSQWRDRLSVRAGAGDTSNGMQRGLRVHRELERWIKAETSDKRRRMRLSPTSRNILNVLIIQLGCVPVQTEVTVACDVNKVATRIDIVCKRMDTNTLVIVEIKTGYGKPRFNAVNNQGHLKPKEFRIIPQSHKVFALLQAAVGAFLYKRTFPRARVTDAYVVRADSENAESYKVPRHLACLVQNLMLRC